MPSEARQPSVTATIDGGSFEVQEMTLNVSVGQPATISVTLHEKAEVTTAREMTSGAMASVMAGQQAKFYGSRSPDLIVNASDGAGGSINFSGYSTSVRNTLSPNNVGLQISGVHSSYILASLNTSIYSNDGKGNEGLDALKAPTGAVLSERLTQTTDNMLEAWERRSEGNVPPDLEAIVQSIDASNGPLLEMWQQLLSASGASTTFDSLAAFDSDEDTLNVEIYNNMKNILRSSPENFFEVIAGLCNSYLMIYVPSLEPEGVGKLALMSYLRGTAEGRSVDETGTELACGNPDITPVTHVMLEGSAIPIFNDEDIQYDENGEPVPVSAPSLVYPDTIFSGSCVFNTSPPPWLADSLALEAKSDEDLKRQADNAPDTLNYRRYFESVQDKVIATREIAVNKVAPVAEAWLKEFYLDLSLANSQGIITTPLDFSWEVGKFYIITSEEGGDILTGLLNTVSHKMIIRPGRGGTEASTTLVFTHVEAAGFSLPGK